MPYGVTKEQLDYEQEFGGPLGGPQVERSRASAELPPVKTPDTLETLGAAFRSYNWIVSTYQRIQEHAYPPEPGFDVFDYLKGTPHEANMKPFIGVSSKKEADAVAAGVRQEQTDKETMANSGLWGGVSAVAAGFASPETLLLPAGAIKAVKGGYSFWKSAGSWAGYGAVQAGLSETGLRLSHYSPVDPEEVVANVATGTVINAMLGGTIARGMTRAERIRSQRFMDAVRARTQPAHADPEGALRTDQASANPAESAAAKDTQAVVTPHKGPDVTSTGGQTVTGDGVEPKSDGRLATTQPGLPQPRPGSRAFSDAALAELPDDLLTPANLRALEAQFEGEQRVAGIAMHFTPAQTRAINAADLRGPDRLIDYDGLQAMKREALRRQGVKEEVPAGEGAWKPGEAPEREGVPPGLKLDAPITEGAAERIRERYDQPGIVEAPPGARGVSADDLAASPAAQSMGAAATDTRTGLLRRLILPLSDRWSPFRRNLREQIPVEARRVWLDLAESTAELDENARGVATTLGPAANRMVRLMFDPLMALVGDNVDRLWAQHLQMQPGRVRKLARQVRDFVSTPEPGTLTLEQFKEEASRVAAVVGAKSSYPEAQELADLIRSEVFDPLAKLAKEINPEFKLVEGEPYFPHYWNKEKIVAGRPDFKRKLTDKYVADQDGERAIQEQLAQLSEALADSRRDLKKLEGRIGTQVGKQAEATAKLEERAMEVRRTGGRVASLEERQQLLRETIDDTQKFLDDMRTEFHDPLLRSWTDELQRRVNQLRARDVPMTQAQMEALESEELRTILTGPTRRAAQMVVGTRKFPKVPSFLSWIAENGGAMDSGGDIASIIGGPRGRPGLINKQVDAAGRPLGRELDEIGNLIQERFPGHFPRRPDLPGGGAPDHNQVLEWIDESSRGHEPDFMLDNVPDNRRADYQAAQLAAVLDEAFSRAGIETKTIADVARVFRDARVEDGHIRLEDLDKVAAEMEAAGQGIPIGARRIHAEEKLAARREDFAQMRQMIADAIKFRDQQTGRLGTEAARATEAGGALEANLGRLGVLEERLGLAETREGLLRWMHQIETQKHDVIRKEIEQQIALFEGKSANEAKSAIRAREKYEATQALAQKGAGPQEPGERVGDRLKMADKSVDDFVKTLLARNLELSRQDLEKVADQTVTRILGSPDGRLNYEESGTPNVGWNPDKGPPPRGSLHERRLDVTNEWAWDWIEHDIEKVSHQYAATLIPDLVLIKKFGDVDMTEAFRKINDGFARLSDEIDKHPTMTAEEKAKAQTQNEENRKAVNRDVAAQRDMIRRVYGWSNDAVQQQLGKYANYAKQVANIVSINAAALASIPDFAGPILRHGMEVYYGEALPLLVRMLRSTPEADPFAHMLYEELRGFGIGIDVALNRNRGMESWSDIYASQSRFGKTLQTANDLSFAVNGLNKLTDVQKQLAGTIAHIMYIRAMRKWMEGTGELGNATEKEVARLASGNINRELAARILRQIDDDTEKLVEQSAKGTIEVSNPALWRDREAAMAFAGLVARDADIAVPTGGAEIPNIMSNPTLGILFQFKRIVMAGTERVLVANLQRPDAQALTGIMHYLLLGMLSTKVGLLTQGEQGQKKAQSMNAAEWTREAIDRSNILGLISETNNTLKKLTGADVMRLFGAEQESTRFQSRNKLETLLGPTAGRINNALQFTYNMGSGNYSASDTRAFRNAFVPWQNLWYTRGLVNQAEQGVNHAFGVPERRER